MTESLKGINPKTLVLFTTPDPNLDPLRRWPSRAAAKDWRKVEPKAREFVRQRGHPWDNLSLVIAGEQVPFKGVSFPYGGIRLSLMVTDPAALIKYGERPAPDLFVEGDTRSASQMWPQYLLFGTDIWRDQEGKRIWFIAPMQERYVNRFMVNCVEAILTLGEEHFAAQNNIPSPS